MIIGSSGQILSIEGIVVVVLALTALVLFIISVNLRKDMIRRKEKGSAIDIGNAQYIGTREKQDDSFATVTKWYGTMAVVADGIGGFLNGNIASKMTVDTFVENYEKGDVTGNVNYYFQSSAKEANFQIRKKFEDLPCGTTVVSVVIIRNMMYWFNVGDSVIALYRNGHLIPINRKQNFKNWLEEQYLEGKIKREEAIDHPQSRRLMNYVGFDGFEGGEECKRPIQLQKGDKVLLYSDGIETLNQIELENILAQKLSANECANMMIERIRFKNVKSKDNATVIVLHVKKQL